MVSFHQLETRVQDLESQWQRLNSLPTNSELFRRVKDARTEAEHAGEEEHSIPAAPPQSEEESALDEETGLPLKKPKQPLADMWQMMQLTKNVERNTDAISKVCNTLILPQNN
jgi:hypothetical protein